MLNKNEVKFEFINNVSVLTVLEGIYKDVKFQYGKVWFENPDSDQPTMQFQYDILGEVKPENKTNFESDIAHLLHTLLLEQLEQGQVVYSGGDGPTVTKTEYEPPQKNAAQMIMAAPGVFTAKPKESAMGFLDRLAMQGLAAMRK